MMRRSMAVLMAATIGMNGASALAADQPCVGADLSSAKAALTQTRMMFDEAIKAVDANDSATAKRLQTWLGATTADHRNKVRDKLPATSVFVKGATFLCTNQSPTKNKDDTLAKVMPNKAFVITLTAHFFTRPEVGFDSRAGVLAHEMTHFVIAGNTDDADDYGKDYAKNLAKSDASRGMNTADSYQYFVESVASNL